ncbi:glutamate ABC transporter substrate-binding protein [Streptomyces sp. V1I1]|uniref:glutamate ABC transporter substrate-binding protein n=1 Tax=Streptomyces sp. V1I1 TaxID=3042272 RepID=UPI002788B777|nr:glutamate ABC transporter substrate-binding protein [Streptomyces sp. V1I1]MDQ0938436.1 glutamate transport system substrate-binding protein [Streptomyces sp. V1I1]
MKPSKSAAFATIAALAVALPATACSGDSGDADDEPTSSSIDGNRPFLPKYTVAEDVKIDSPTLRKARRVGKLVIGAHNDQPFLGFEEKDGRRSGFDIEIAKMVAADLGFSPDKIEFRTVDTKNREAAISSGQVDLYVGTYTINDERKKKVGFAGPYYRAGADLLVRKNDSTIGGPYSLEGKKVCAVKGSTALREIQKPEYNTTTVETTKDTECVQQLLDKKIDAVTTDDAILMGYAAQRPDKLKVVGMPFTEEPYGIGMNKDDEALRQAVTDALEAHDENGNHKRAYAATLGLSGSKYNGAPGVEHY